MKIKLLFITALFSIIAYAQDKVYGKPEILSGKEVKILPRPKNAAEPTYKYFFEDEKMYKPYKGKHSIAPLHLENRIFKVTEVVKLPESPYGQFFRIGLQDVATNETLYFNYKQSSEGLGYYYFEVVGGLTYPEGFFCDMVIKQESNTSTTYTTTKNYVGNFIEKRIDLKTKKEVYVFNISASEVKAPVKKQGVVLNLENGTKIDLPQHVFSYEGQKYFTTIELTKPQLDLLAEHALLSTEIGGVQLFTYKKEFFFIQELLKCMLTMK